MPILLAIGVIALMLVGIVGVVPASAGKKRIKSPPDQDLADLVNGESLAKGLSPFLVYGLIETESDWNPNAKNPSDPSFGLMQITPSVFEDYGMIGLTESQMMEPDRNIRVGVAFLANLINRNGVDAGIQAYNVGEFGYRKLGRRNPVYLERVKSHAKEYGWEE